MQHSHRIYKKHTKNNIISICILSINTEIKNLKKKTKQNINSTQNIMLRTQLMKQNSCTAQNA